MVPKGIGWQCYPLILCLLVCFVPLAEKAKAQGTSEAVYVVRPETGSGPLVTASHVFLFPSSSTALSLELDFGFATSETVAPQTFYDSVTLTLQDGSGNTAIFATIDASGVSWSPPGGIALPGSIVHQVIAPPSLTPAYPHQWAYHAVLPVPPVMTGGPVTLYLDLFDNQNGVGSLGWMGGPVFIPEPGSVSLLVLGFALLATRKFCSTTTE